MAVSWTEAQADAISARKGSVLVAAAAGSGKTAVLVQRAIERLTDLSVRPGGPDAHCHLSPKRPQRKCGPAGTKAL
ncbi:MAG: UvrD-helicase domain-containing protein [Eubacteriales bacterium]